MKLSTCFIFLFLIFILFDLNKCRKSNKKKVGKNVKNQENAKCESQLCMDFCKRGIKAMKRTTLIEPENMNVGKKLDETYLMRRKRTARNTVLKKIFSGCLFCCGSNEKDKGDKVDDKRIEEIIRELQSNDPQVKLKAINNLDSKTTKELKARGYLGKTERYQTRDNDQAFQDELAQAIAMSLEKQKSQPQPSSDFPPQEIQPLEQHPEEDWRGKGIAEDKMTTPTKSSTDSDIGTSEYWAEVYGRYQE